MTIDGFVFSSIFLAVILNALVRIGTFGIQSLSSNVGKSSVSAATLASESGVIGRAINNLLFGKDDVITLNPIEAFDQSC